MADNSEIIVGGGQAITPDQATIDELVEKLRQKLIAREMDPERIQQLVDKYRNYLPSWLTLTHKYITLYPLPTGNADYNRDYETIYTEAPVFEEVNWSAVDYPEERPDEYRFSRRLSNMYHHKTHIDNPPMYKFEDIDETVTEEELHWVFNEETGEYEQVPRDMVYKADATGIIDRYDQSTSFRLATYNHNDDIRKIFFLEIVWGYSGWEWHDYERVIGTDPETEEPITETLKGGNLYKIKNIQTVPHIIDGHRLQHINDFLFSQYNVSHVEGFNTQNLVAANRAFKRGTNDDTSYPNRHLANAIPMTLLDAKGDDDNLLDHYFGYADEANNYYTLPKLLEADGLFYNNDVFVKDEPFNAEPIVIPNIKNIDRLYAYGFYTEGLKFKFNSLEKLTRPFMEACFYHSPLNLNDVFIGDTLKKVDDFSYMLGGASFIGWIEGTNHNMEISLDLTSSTVDADDVINLSHFVEWAGTKENGNDYSVTSNSGISVNLNFNNKVNLDYAFSYLIGTKPYGTYYGDDIHNYHRVGSFERMSLNFNSKENYITSIIGGLKNNTFTETPPIIQVPNNACDDSYIYQSCIFNAPVSYNFLNGSIVSPRTQGYGQFNDCTINDSYTFSNIQGLDRVEFCGIKFGDNALAADRTFPYVVQSGNTYRYFDMCASKFTGMDTQNIYIDTVRFRTESTKYDIGSNSRRGGANTINPFDNCSEVTDLSNVNLYYSDVNDEVEVLVPSDTRFTLSFANCTNLTKSPHIHLLYKRTGLVYFNLSFRELEYLEDVNLEDLSVIGTGTSTNITIFDFQDCVALKNLRIGTNTTNGFRCSLDIRGCFALNTPANIAVLKTTLDKLGDHTTLWIMESTWRAVNDDNIQTGYFVTKFANINVSVKRWDDSSYVPGSPRN